MQFRTVAQRCRVSFHECKGEHASFFVLAFAAKISDRIDAHVEVLRPDAAGNRPAATATEDQGMNRRVRLTGILGPLARQSFSGIAEEW